MIAFTAFVWLPNCKMMVLPMVNPMTVGADGHGGLKEHVVECFHANYGDINLWLGYRMT